MKMECFVLDVTEQNLDIIRSFSEDFWLNSGQIGLLSPVPDTLASALRWIGDWHVRWDESVLSVDEMEELTQELDAFMASNADEFSRMESPMGYLLLIYDNMHFTVGAMRNNTINRSIGLTSNWDTEISQLPSPCEIPDMDGIPQHLEEAVSNLATECLVVELAEYQLTVLRKLTEETWFRGFIRN